MKSNGIKKNKQQQQKNEQKNTTMIMYVYIDCSRLNGVSGSYCPWCICFKIKENSVVIKIRRSIYLPPFSIFLQRRWKQCT